jgi:hypothetical protein
MSRSAHHRADFRNGPHTGWLQRKSRHVARACVRPTLALDRLLTEVERSGCRLNPAVVLEARQARDIAWDYATDETGDVWA